MFMKLWKKLVRPLVVAWWTQMKTREWLTGTKYHVPQKNIMLFTPIEVERRLWRGGCCILQGLVAVNDTPTSRQNFEMVLSCRYAEVLWSWCNCQFARVYVDTGLASRISQQHISPVDKCFPNFSSLYPYVIECVITSCLTLWRTREVIETIAWRGEGEEGSVTSLEGSYPSPDRPSDTNIIKMIEKMVMLEWWP